MVSLEESSLVVFCYLSASEIWPDKRGGLSRGEQFSSILLSVHLKSGLIRGVISLEESSLVVFCYLSTSEIWPVKRGSLSRGEQLSSILLSVHLKSGLKRELVFGSNDLVREGLLDMYI